LTAKNVIIPEKVIFAWVLNNLSPNYETLITTITQSIRVNGSGLIKLEELFSNLIDESKRLKHKDSGETALVTTKQKSKYKPYNANKVSKNKSNKNSNKSITCEHCRKKGHKIEKCWIKHPELRPNKLNKTEEITMYSNIEKDLDTCLDNSNETDLAYWSFPRKCMKSIKNIVLMIFMLFLLTVHLLCKCIKCEFKNLCKKHEHKIIFLYFYNNFNVMYKFASYCTVHHLKFNRISKTEHVINEFAKFAFAKYAFAKSVRILQIREITKLIYNTISISNENVNKINALDKTVYSTILNKSN